MLRPGSPDFGFSTLTTSAPRKASASVQDGPASNCERSRTRTPLRQASDLELLCIASSSPWLTGNRQALGTCRPIEQRVRVRAIATIAGLPSHRRNGRYPRTDRTREPERRRGEQKPAAVAGPQPVGELREAPQLPQVDSDLEQAVLVQRQQGALSGLQRLVGELHRIIVRD